MNQSQIRANRRAWIRALRSGKYKETPKGLHREGAFSAMGVACEISGLGSWVNSRWVVDNCLIYKTKTEESSSSLPMEVCHSLGITTRLNRIPFIRAMFSLQNEGNDFNEIAGYLEYVFAKEEPYELVANHG